MPTVGAYEAKTKFSELLERVANGERFVITRHGSPVAVLQPVPSARKTDPQRVIASLKAFRRAHRLEGSTLRDLIEEGRG